MNGVVHDGGRDHTLQSSRFHLRGVVLGRDFQAETADIRTVLEGEQSVDGQGPIELVPVIEGWLSEG